MTAVTVYIDGPLLVPVNTDLLTRVRTRLRCGERGIVLDLSSVSLIDAGGVGELVRTYNVACAMDVSLRIVHTTKWVRETLERVGLFDMGQRDRVGGYGSASTFSTSFGHVGQPPSRYAASVRTSAQTSLRRAR